MLPLLLSRIAVFLSLAQITGSAEPPLTPHLLGRVQGSCLAMPAFDTAEQSTEWSGVLRRQGVAFWVVGFQAANKGLGDWKLTLSNPGSNTPVAEILSSHVSNGFEWTSPELKNGATIQIKGDLRDLRVQVTHCVVGAPEADLKSYVGENDLKHIGDYRQEPLYQWGKSVARLKVVDEAGYFSCTAFLIEASLLLTNAHCTSPRWKTMVAEFNAERGNLGAVDPSNVIKVVATDPVVDVALLRLGAPAKYPPVKLAQTDVDTGVNLIVIQHPSGEEKQVARDNCRSTSGATAVSQFAHICDTAKGSSGSPVFASDGSVVGLHRKGFKEGVPGGRNQAVTAAKLQEFLKKATLANP